MNGADGLKHWVLWRPPACGKSGRWVLRFEVAPGKRRDVTVARSAAPGPRDERAAVRWAEGQLPKLRGSAPAAAVEKTIAELVPLFLALAKGRASTLAEYESHSRLSIVPRLGEELPAALDVPRLRDFVRGLVDEGLGRSTISNRLSTLAILVDTARAEGWTTAPNQARDPAVRACLPPAKRRRVCTIAPRHLAAVAATEAIPPVRRLRYLLASHGLEDGVIAALRWDDIHLEEPGREWIHVHAALAMRGPQGYATEQGPKNDYRLRPLPIAPYLADALRWWRDEGWEIWAGGVPEGHDRVLLSARGKAGRPKSAKLFREDLRRAGVPLLPNVELDFKSLRAYFGTQLAELGASDAQRARLLGHRGPTTAARYYTTDIIEADRELVSKLPPAPMKVHRGCTGATNWSRLRDLNSRPTVYEVGSSEARRGHFIPPSDRAARMGPIGNGTGASNGSERVLVRVHEDDGGETSMRALGEALELTVLAFEAAEAAVFEG